MHGGQFLELLLLKWSDFDNSKIAAGYFTHNYGLDLEQCFGSKLGTCYYQLVWTRQDVC